MAAKKKATKKKAAAKKVVAKKTVAKKASSKASAVAKTAAKKVTAPLKKSETSPIKDVMSKASLFTHLSEVTGVSKKDVVAIFNELTVVIERHVKKNSAEEFKLPGLLKIKVINKPARKARKGINPFTGEEVMFKAKPKSRAVKVQALKSLKGMVA
ncbi:MAG: HU family DNA-binding protein [Gammaproteobacteria bacterium]|nr:HU family DNA-binding protein [Gammaproteobacteria bacterium]